MGALLARAAAGMVLYAGLVTWLTWPLAARAATHLPAPFPLISFDTLYAAWALAWQSHALVTAPTRLFEANIYHPDPHALFYGPMGLGALPYFLPPFVVTGNPALAFNLTFLTCATLTATSLHLVAWRWTGSHLAGFVAAATFLATPWSLRGWGTVTPNYAVLQYFPLILLVLSMGARARGVALAVLIVLQGLADLYVAGALLVPLGLLVLVRLVRPSVRHAGARLLGAVAVGGAVVAVGYAGQIAIRLANPDLAHQTNWLLPAAPIRLPSGLLGRDQPTAVPVAALVLVALGLVVRLLAGRRRDDGADLRRAGWAQAGFWVLVGTLISLTPVVVWQGRPITLPQGHLAAWLPAFRVLRVPARLGLGALIGLALLAGLAFAECARVLGAGAGRGLLARLGPPVLAVVVAGAMYDAWARGLYRPGARRAAATTPSYRVVPAPTLEPAIAAALRARDGPLLVLPVGRQGTGAGRHAYAMYESIFHWRPLLNGYSSYWPAGFPDRMALARQLPDREALAELRRRTGLATILVRTKPTMPLPPSWLMSGSGAGVRLVAVGGRSVLLAVEDPRDPPAGRARRRGGRRSVP
jgi:hypothetical protein